MCIRDSLIAGPSPAAPGRPRPAHPPHVSLVFGDFAGLGVQPHPPRRLGVMARLYLAIAVVSGAMWLTVILWGMGPLLLLAHPLVWAAALSLGAIKAVATSLFVRGSFGVRIRPSKPRRPRGAKNSTG